MMPAKSYKSEVVILATLGIFSAVVVLLLLAHGWLGEQEAQGLWVRTSRSTNVEGTIVCYTLFERLGVPLSRSDKPLLDETLQQIDVLYLIDPIVPVQRGEQVALSQWVSGGGVLVCTSSGSGFPFTPHGIGEHPSNEDNSLEAPSLTHAEARASFPTQVPAEAPALPLARGVSEVHLDDACVLDVNKEMTSASRVPAEKLFADTCGVRIAAWRTGVGRVIVLSNSSFLSNRHIGKKDNAILAVNLGAYALSQAQGGRAAFDEYHYGFGTRETGWAVLTGTLFRTTPGWAILSVAASGVLFLVYKGRRFGTRRAPGRARRRSKLEYVHAVGATYLAAGAHRLAFNIIFQWFRRRSTERAGLPTSAPSTEIAARLARRTGASAERYAGILQDCEAALAGPTLSPRRMSTLLGQLAAIESEVFDGHSRRR
jgi:hypothetical protein